MKNAFVSIRRFDKSIWGTHESAFDLCPAFLHISSTWVLKSNLLSILMPKSFSYLLLVML